MTGLGQADDSRTGALRNLGTRLRAHRSLWLLLLLALVIKVAYLLDYTALPFLDAPLFDSTVYLRQAQAVRAGDLAHPTLLALSPLYGYFLALFEPVIVSVQVALGLGNLALVYAMSAAHFGRRAAVISTALCLGYGWLTFQESKIMAETLGVFLALSAMAVYLSSSFRRGHPLHALAAGALLGLATLARANMLFVLPFAVLGAAAMPPAKPGARPRRAWLSRTVGLTLGLALVLGANGTATWSRTGFFVPVIMVSRTAAVATGQSAEWSGQLSGVTRSGGAVSAWDVVDQARARLEGTAKPDDQALAIDWAGYFRGAPAKLLGTFGDTETGFQYGYFGERSELTSLMPLSVSFGLIAALALLAAGFLLRERGLRALLPYLPYVLGALVTTTLFHPSSRYRLPMVLPFVVLSGYAVDRVLAMTPGWRRRLVAGALALLAAFFCIRTATYELVHPGLWQLRVAEAEVVRGDRKAARARIARALQVEPDTPSVRARARYVVGMLEGRRVRPE